MTIDEIIILLEKKLSNLYILRNMSINTGDFDSVVRLENEIQETEESLFVLKK